jgi:hypothetical protein
VAGTGHPVAEADEALHSILVVATTELVFHRRCGMKQAQATAYPESLETSEHQLTWTVSGGELRVLSL